jgi:hypothetical protein
MQSPLGVICPPIQTEKADWIKKHPERRSPFHLAYGNRRVLALFHLGLRFMRSVCILDLKGTWDGCIEPVL